MKREKRGFTVIELLVVVAIIATLLGISVGIFTRYSMKARDARVKADLRNIATALDIYYSKYGTYPTTSVSGNENANGSCSAPGCGSPGWIPELVNEGIISSVPVHPRNPSIIMTDYQCSVAYEQFNWYVYSSNGNHYILCSWLEDASDPSAIGNIDCLPSPWNPANCINWWGYADNSYVIGK